MVLAGVLTAVGGYLMGSIPTGVVLARAFTQADIRRAGSGNIGATNVYRTAGRLPGLLTLIGDVLKGVVPVLIGRYALDLSRDWLALAALAAFLGHLYPIYLSWRGGKGVATFFGIFLALSPLAAAASAVLWLGTVRRWGYSSLGSLVAALAMPTWIGLFGYPRLYILLSAVVATFIVLRHRENISRLLGGTEAKVAL
ncbi:MAG: glycerol-3-phosphate 1-O-acyltransferase PlsY [Deltaproteobacteria bacterium]|nr:glycerol-3-phosphate 1-O-acyltransferase PlsY [Deltaproteobacteria bacterium]MBI3077837.1 glycerol-3-phosphate 1-O-acyltransferase PlsY [Deltaproteobacteria bacterium]